jgi:transglutaminase-like putative cysteine protease
MSARPPGGGRDRLLLVNEVALALVTVTAIVGMHRLFVDGSYRGPLVVQAVLAHVVVAVLRRRGVPLGRAALATAAVAVLSLTWSRFPDTTRWLLPTADTVAQLGDDLSEAWRVFGKVRAPAPVENGFLAATGAVVWVLVYLADWAAFRVSATFEALLPATTLFIFAAALGGPGSPVASAALFSGAGLLYVLLHRTSSQERSTRWAGGRRDQGRWSLVTTGSTLIGAAVLAGVVAGPNLPGSGSRPLLAWRDLNRDTPTRVVLSPMVSLQTKIVEQPDVEVFTVRSERSSYWRLTSLDEFDGEIWRSSYSTDDADGELPRALDPKSETETVTQEVTISALSSVWLPAAYEPVALDARGQAVDVDARSSTLMVDRDVPTSDGYTYTVTSAMPLWSAAELRTASPDVPDEIAATYLQLPERFPELVETEAYEITRAATTPYDKARALQDYLRSDLFTYDDQVGPGHSDNALLTFLFETRRGYCEQFASAFAAMARSAGLPARVAVGFTPGARDRRNDPTLFRVRGVHAHAWPEVYLGEYGWVPFEPTPTRGPPGGEGWLGVPESQDTSAGGSAATGGEPLEGSGDGAGGTGDTAASGDDRRGPRGDLGAGGTAGGRPDRADDAGMIAETVSLIGPRLGLAALAYVVLMPAAIAGRQVVRRRRARTPAARARLSWQRATENASTAGVSLPPSLTIAEAADRIGERLPAAAAAIQELARTMESLAYAEVTPPAGEMDRAERAAATTVQEARRHQSWVQRVAAYLDVRLLFGPRHRKQVAYSGAEAEIFS